jgi:hypothetical protein
MMLLRRAGKRGAGTPPENAGRGLSQQLNTFGEDVAGDDVSSAHIEVDDIVQCVRLHL